MRDLLLTAQATFRDLLVAIETTFDEWLRLRFADLEFGAARTSLLVFVVVLAIAAMALSANIAKPRILTFMCRSYGYHDGFDLQLFLAGR